MCSYEGDKQSPIELDSQHVVTNKDTYLFGDYYQTTGTVNYLNTTIYINTSSSFGSLYTRIIDGTAMPFKATELRFRMHAEHKV